MPFSCARPDGVNTLPDQRKRYPMEASIDKMPTHKEMRPCPEPSYGAINEPESRLGLWDTLKLAMRDQSKLTHD